MSQICLSKQKFLGKFNGIVIELFPKFELNRTRIENKSPFFRTSRIFQLWYSSTRQNVKLIDNCACKDIIPDVKILQAFEMRKDAAAEVLETDGWCNQEGKRGGGAKRVHVDASYAPLRARLGIV